MREGAWVGRAPAGSGSGRHVEEGTWCCSNDDACRSAAPPIAPLPSRRVAASRGQYRWCGGGGSLHRPAAGAAITSMRGGCRRLVWLEAYAAPPKPYCRSSAWRLGRAAVVVADGIWRRRRRLALPSGRNSDPAALAGGGAPTATRPWLRIHLTPFLLNGYPCLLCPCVVCFKFLQPKVIEGKKIDCALADPHLPRLLGGAPQLFTTSLVLFSSTRHRFASQPAWQCPTAARAAGPAFLSTMGSRPGPRCSASSERPRRDSRRMRRQPRSPDLALTALHRTSWRHMRRVSEAMRGSQRYRRP